MNWIILLAGGSGSRLASESARRYGYARPKQYSDFGGGTLLELTLARARRLVPDERIVVITTRAHRAHALEILRDHPRLVHLEQPQNRDTTAGLLYPLLHVRAMCPSASVLVMPTDHAVADERVFHDALLEATRAGVGDHIALLVAEPSGSLDDYGWVVPRRDGDTRWSTVAHFREKPRGDELRQLLSAGARVNTFVFAARAAALEEAIARRAPETLRLLRTAVDHPHLVDDIFAELPSSNFSRDVLEREVDQLRVVPLSGHAGWSDIGTPERLAQCTWTRPLARAVGA